MVTEDRHTRNSGASIAWSQAQLARVQTGTGLRHAFLLEVVSHTYIASGSGSRD